MDREFVRGLLVEASFAYGFTIAFWGSGVLIVNEYGLPHTPGVLAYAVGAVTGFGLLIRSCVVRDDRRSRPGDRRYIVTHDRTTAASFGGVFTRVTPERTPQYVLLAGVHHLASLVPIVVTHLVLIAPVGTFGSLFLVGTNVSVVYNIAAAMEESVSEWMLQHDPR